MSQLEYTDVRVGTLVTPKHSGITNWNHDNIHYIPSQVYVITEKDLDFFRSVYQSFDKIKT